MLAIPAVNALKSNPQQGYVIEREFALPLDALDALFHLLEDLNFSIKKCSDRLELCYLDGFGLPLFAKNRLLVGTISTLAGGETEYGLQYFKKNKFIRKCFSPSDDWPLFHWQIPDGEIRSEIKKPLGYWSLHTKMTQRLTMDWMSLSGSESSKKPEAQLNLATVFSEADHTYVIGVLYLRVVHMKDDVNCMKAQKSHQDKIVVALKSFLHEHGIQLKHTDHALYTLQAEEQVKANRITRDMSMELALQLMLSEAVAGMQLYHRGLLDDIDTEFLHQFRVHVRKTRSLMKECKKFLGHYDFPLREFKEFFKHLNNITSSVRDLDVYLLQARQWIEDRDDIFAEQIAPFIQLLQHKRGKAFKEMTAYLDGDDYRQMIQHWEEVVDSLPQYRVEEQSKKPQDIGRFAQKKISKLFHQLLAEGSVLDEQTPDTEYHQLRLVFKRFRYLLDFFEDLFEVGKEREVFEKLFKRTKVLQTLLGDFQDITVQKGKLMRYAEELAELSEKNGGSEPPVSYLTFLAMGELMGGLNSNHDLLKHQFTVEFEKFQKNKGLHEWLD